MLEQRYLRFRLNHRGDYTVVGGWCSEEEARKWLEDKGMIPCPVVVGVNIGVGDGSRDMTWEDLSVILRSLGKFEGGVGEGPGA